jgi:CRISPR-associated protein Cmr1
MINITFEIETITPMFLSGADQSKAELRAASIKGLLRFWWRALQAEPELVELRKKESRIFGSSDEKLGGGSNFSIRISHEPLKAIKDKFPNNPQYQMAVEGKTFKINILEYLAYGTYDYIPKQGNVFNREYLPMNSNFSLIINLTNELWKDEILKTMFVFSLFSGVGARSRNGFGSFEIANKAEAFGAIKDKFSTSNAYEKENLRELVRKTDNAAYSSFSRLTKLYKAKSLFNSAYDSLADVGKIYKNARGSMEQRHAFDKRQYIGAPIVEKKVTHSFLERHAKPYFIKIAKEGNKYRSYILYLPSQYCTGLSEDRNKKQINHSAVDRKFAEVCSEFNTFLSQNMEPIL